MGGATTRREMATGALAARTAEILALTDGGGTVLRGVGADFGAP